MARCRCGHDLSSQAPHPCHANVYGCRRPAREHVHVTYDHSGAVETVTTWACDEHWGRFLARLAGNVTAAADAAASGVPAGNER